MNWTDEIHILRRIVALLLALADLAERAGSVPRAAREGMPEWARDD